MGEGTGPHNHFAAGRASIHTGTHARSLATAPERSGWILLQGGEPCGRAALLTGTVTRDAPLGFPLRTTGGMAEDCREDGLLRAGRKAPIRMRRVDRGRAVRTRFGRSLEVRVVNGESVPFPHAHDAVVLSFPAAARRKARLAALTKGRHRDERGRQGDHQQDDGEKPAHVPSIETLLAGRNTRAEPCTCRFFFQTTCSLRACAGKCEVQVRATGAKCGAGHGWRGARTPQHGVCLPVGTGVFRIEELIRPGSRRWG